MANLPDEVAAEFDKLRKQIITLKVDALSLWSSHEVAVVAIGSFLLGVLVEWIF